MASLTDDEVITVLVSDRHALFRRSLAAALGSEPDMEVVADAGDGAAAILAIDRLNPDVALVDSGLGVPSGLEVCVAVKASSVATAILLVHDGPDRRVLLAAIRAGADGFVTRVQPLGEVIAAVRRVHRGEAPLPAAMLGPLLRDLVAGGRQTSLVLDRLSRLTRRERQVYRLLLEGLDHRAIADVLVLSPHTARTHIQNILEKLDVHSRVEAAALAIEYDLMAHIRLGR